MQQKDQEDSDKNLLLATGSDDYTIKKSSFCRINLV